MTFYCIYRITNKINGKTYIGQHKYADDKDPMGKYWGGGTMLRYAFRKYGKDNFEREVIYRRIRDKETVDAMEVWMIAKERRENKNGCYNIANGGGGINHINFPEELRRKMSEAHKGQTSWNKGKKLSEEHKCKLREAKKYISDETRKKMSEAKKGHIPWNKGKKWSEDVIKKLSEAHKGQVPGNKGKTGRHWYTNGEIDVICESCPEGFVLGRIYKRKGGKK